MRGRGVRSYREAALLGPRAVWSTGVQRTWEKHSRECVRGPQVIDEGALEGLAAGRLLVPGGPWNRQTEAAAMCSKICSGSSKLSSAAWT